MLHNSKKFFILRKICIKGGWDAKFVKRKEIYFDENLIKKIKDSSSALVVWHVKPDFNCLGAMVGMREILEILEILGKNVSLVINDGG